jgi:MFS family permease
MSELANILSFGWTTIGQGRRLVPFINALQVGVIGSIALIALLPTSQTGLYLLVAVVLAARVCWSGIVTFRTSLWRANYPPHLRAVIVGRLSALQVLVVAITGASLGRLLDYNASIFRVVLPLACAASFIALLAYSRIRVRREWRLRRATPGAAVMKPWHGPVVVWRVLRADRRYAQFMACISLFGFGNLMVIPVLVITLREEFGFRYFTSILITSSIPAIVQLAAIPAWARFLDRAHVVRFRSIHSWSFVAASLVFTVGALLHHPGFFFAGSALLGLAYGGGAIAWNLGHVDFSPPSQTSHYMATHVTLNGVRGLLAPLAAVAGYEALKRAGLDATLWMLIAAVFINTAGATGFVLLRRSMAVEMRGFQRRG